MRAARTGDGDNSFTVTRSAARLFGPVEVVICADGEPAMTFKGQYGVFRPEAS